MARDAVNKANQLYGQSQDVYNQATGKANDLYNQLSPTYTQEATNPQGFGKTGLADLNTAAQQSFGGGVGAAVGEAGTKAAANRNLGSFAPALDEASRNATRGLGDATLKTQLANEALKQEQRQQGIGGLQGLEGQQNQDVLSSLGIGNQAVNTAIEGGKSGWFQNMIALINAVKPSGGGSQPQYSGGNSSADQSGAPGPGSWEDSGVYV